MKRGAAFFAHGKSFGLLRWEFEERGATITTDRKRWENQERWPVDIFQTRAVKSYLRRILGYIG